MARNLTPIGSSGELSLYWELEIAEVISRHKNIAYRIKSKSHPNKTRILHCNMLKSVNHLLEAIVDAVPTIYPIKNKIPPEMKNNVSPERKIKLLQRIREKQKVQVKNQTE